MSSFEAFSVDVVHLDGSVVLRLRGELDMATAPVLGRAVSELVSPHLRAIVLDLEELGFVDVAGMRGLLFVQQLAITANSTFHLRKVGEKTGLVIRLAKFRELSEAIEPILQ